LVTKTEKAFRRFQVALEVEPIGIVSTQSLTGCAG
jgi:hypothetical protein